MPTPRQLYASELRTIAQRYGALEETTTRRMLELLVELRARITAELSVAENWNAYRLRQLQANIEAMIGRFEADLGVQLRQSFVGAYMHGGQAAVDPFRAAGIVSMFFQPATAQLNVVLDFSARLVRDIGNDMRHRIDQQIRLAVLGQKAPLDAMRAVTDELGIEARAGVWARRKPPTEGIAARAETIVRTEMARAYNLSTYSQQQEQAARIPGLTKSWMATADSRTRQSHLAAHRRYADHPIPIGEPFIVGGAELMFPGDPNGPAEETIHCRCKSMTHHPALGRVGTPLDARIRQELERRHDD